MTKSELVSAIRAFISQRPGLDFSNYGDVRYYRADARVIARQLADARVFLGIVEYDPEITVEMMLRELPSRLSISDGRLNYCTGQYRPTEYRAAAARWLSNVVWAAKWSDLRRENKDITADDIRLALKRQFSRGIFNRHFA